MYLPPTRPEMALRMRTQRMRASQSGPRCAWNAGTGGPFGIPIHWGARCSRALARVGRRAYHRGSRSFAPTVALDRFSWIQEQSWEALKRQIYTPKGDRPREGVASIS